MDRFPPEVWMRIWEFDSTYHDHYRLSILPHMTILRSQCLAHDYYDGHSECRPTSFRFYQNEMWFTASFEETEWNDFQVTLYNENSGMFCRHRHRVF